MRIDPEARRVGLLLLAQGEATLAEIAELAGVSRQLVRHWAKRAGVQWQRVRQDRLGDKWRKEMHR